MSLVINYSLSEHHLIPRSRGGSNEKWNLVMLTHEVHSAWHNLFSNLLPAEVLHLISVIGLETDKRRESWRILFENRTAKEVADLIEKQWTPKKPRRKSLRRREEEKEVQVYVEQPGI